MAGTLLNQNANVSAWQSFINSILELPSALQIGIMLSMQTVQTGVEIVRRLPFTEWAIIPNRKVTLEDQPDVGSILMEVLNITLLEWMKPNLGGIVINSTDEVQSRNVDISDNMIIIQGVSGDNGVNREYNTDNSAPHPRQWHIEGYLSQSVPYADEHFVLKQSLIAQQMMLDAYAASRKPVFYKSALCPVPTRVLIEDYKLGRKIEGLQAYSITLDIREFVTYKVPFYTSERATFTSIPDTGTYQATITQNIPSVLRR